MKSYIDSLNFYQFISILWCISLIIDMLRGKIDEVMTDIIMIIINIIFGEWIC